MSIYCTVIKSNEEGSSAMRAAIAAIILAILFLGMGYITFADHPTSTGQEQGFGFIVGGGVFLIIAWVTRRD